MAEKPTEHATKDGSDLAPEFKARIWQPGKSGNPGGRPKGLRAQVLDATDGGRDIVKVLVEILTAEKAKHTDRLTAADMLLDRGFGKAVAVTLTANAGNVDGLPDGLSEAGDALLESIARRLAAKRPTLEPTRAPVSLPVNAPDLEPVKDGKP